jgi:glucan phosphoethanolaminetransferase (alkaline phosphatase superfamily)
MAVGIVSLLLLPFVLPVQNSLLHEILCVVRQVNNIKNYQNDNADFEYHAYRDSVDSNEVYVLSIGESVRYKNLSLNGSYPRNTTPLLEQQSNLCLYSDYYANATLTQHALPMLLTDVSCRNFEWHFGRKTIAAAFHETGFRTALISHRAQLMNNGYHDYLAKDFDTVVFVAHDSLIASEIAKIVKNNAKNFIVTHYLGNHMFYTNRTEDCLVWRPDYNADPKAKSDSLFLNAYDNSLLYTDRLLTNEIETLKQMHRLAAWLFVSDHGEYISPKVSGHGHTYHPTKEEYHVPLMVWYSDEYKETFPNKVANVIKHKDYPACADHVFWSVLDMAGIRIDSTLQQVGVSIFGDTLLPHQRTLLLPDGESVMMLD